MQNNIPSWAWYALGAVALGGGTAAILSGRKTKFEEALTNANNPTMGIRDEDGNGWIENSDVTNSAQRAWESLVGDDGTIDNRSGEKSAALNGYGIKFPRKGKITEQEFIDAFRAAATNTGLVNISASRLADYEKLQPGILAGSQPQPAAYDPSQFGYNPSMNFGNSPADAEFQRFLQTGQVNWGAAPMSFSGQPSMAQNVVSNQGNQRGQGIWNFLLGGLQGLMGGNQNRGWWS